MEQMTIDQAAQNIDGVLSVVRNPALTRQEHDLLRMSLQLLYGKAKDTEEAEQQQPNVIPMPTSKAMQDPSDDRPYASES